MTARAQLQLLHWPIAGVMPIDLAEANGYLVAWQHKLGPVNRPFRSEAFALEIDGRVVDVAVSCSTVSSTVAGFKRSEVVELARLCAEPGNRWANRVMLRIWREVLAPRWKCWPVRAAVSYSKNALHRGDLYRADGWEKVRDDCGSGGGGQWSEKRDAADPLSGNKTLWLWRYAA
jgi:hypothetical protein